MVTHGDEQVEEEFPASWPEHFAAAGFLHLGLHGAAALEGLAAPDDECQVMGAQAAVGVGRMRIAVLRAAKDGADVDAGLQSLLSQRQPLEFLQPITVCGAVDYRVAEQVLVEAGEKHDRLDRRRGALACAATSVLWLW